MLSHVTYELPYFERIVRKFQKKHGYFENFTLDYQEITRLSFKIQEFILMQVHLISPNNVYLIYILVW